MSPPAGAHSVTVDLPVQPAVEEEVTVVASTRTGRRLEDEPVRVEVLGREEIEEKMLMTPGDIVMMLNEMGGMRVQATSPSIGAASVRVQGMKGRYTRFLSDGLPLFGQQVGGLGLLQIPPMDLGQVEVIKGAASALYGAGAMGGVVNLLSRRPGPEPVREMLVNRSTLGGTDAVAFLSSPLGAHWSASLLGGGHWQTRNDIDDDGWADVAGYGRGIARPRLFWDGGGGRSAFVTAGVTYENRDGGTMTGATLPATGLPYQETLDTRRYDVGGTLQTLVKNKYVMTARAAAAWQRQDHVFGDVVERDAHDTSFVEVTARGAAGRQTWVAGAAYERDAFNPRDVPRFAYTYDVPGLFVQDDIDVASWMSVSASARVDFHSEYGTFFSPRLALLFRREGWTSRLSAAQGFFASTPLTEETEAAGLSRLDVIRPLEAERGRTASLDLTRTADAGSFTVTLFASRVDDPVAVNRDDGVCALQPRPGIDQHRCRTAGDVAPRAVRSDLQLHLRPVARGIRWPSSGDAPDPSAQRGAGRHVGARGRWPCRHRGLLHRSPTARGQSLPRRVARLRDSRRARRAAVRTRPALPQRREPHRHPPDAVGPPGAAVAKCRRTMDGGWLGAARRACLQRRGAPGVLRLMAAA